MAPIRKLLIANRGEIALRILRTCREMGIETVAVYSTADREALHVRFANEAYLIGEPAPSDSYLRGDRILEVAKESGADAIHPGFGFLAENAEFVQATEQAGIRFVGPPATAMAVMGDKLASRQAMIRAGVPVVPGGDQPLPDRAAALAEASRIGYPVMLKASAGGGGKGIRIVRGPADMEAAFTTARGEAESAFGDGRMYIEKYLEQPRHIEVQILGDLHGHLVAIGERECSIQRRNQKLIEEAPAANLPEETRLRLHRAAVEAARAVNYHSAGTVEFLYSKGEFYFLEMNTRLQVEHAVTEEVFGIDLVAQMIRVAEHQPLGLPENLAPRGHSIEVRLNAEDPKQDYMPSLGTIRNLRLPAGPGVRIDSAIYQGMKVTPYYDSMLAKLVVHGANREQARQRMIRALQELHVGGVTTSAGLALSVLQAEAFRTGHYDTGFLERFRDSGESPRRNVPDDLEEIAMLVAAMHRYHHGRRRQPETASGATTSPWVQAHRSRLYRGERL